LTQDANDYSNEVSEGDVQPSQSGLTDRNMTDQDYVKLAQIINEEWDDLKNHNTRASF
jgi:hypothetical protein